MAIPRNLANLAPKLSTTGGSFATTIGVGAATPAASGAGITFPNTWPTHASSDANTLDDYEEGTWTPVLEGASTAGTYTYDATRTLGTYTKIGNTVFLSGSLRVSGVTSAGTGDARIGGLPFTPSTANQGSYTRRPHPVLLQSGATLSSSSIFSAVESGLNYVTLLTQSTSSVAAVSVTDADYIDSVWAFSVVYKVS